MRARAQTVPVCLRPKTTWRYSSGGTRAPILRRTGSSADVKAACFPTPGSRSTCTLESSTAERRCHRMNSNRKLTFLLLSVIGLWAHGALAQDVIGSKDHPLVSRYPNSVITKYG